MLSLITTYTSKQSLSHQQVFVFNFLLKFFPMSKYLQLTETEADTEEPLQNWYISSQKASSHQWLDVFEICLCGASLCNLLLWKQ